MNLLSESASRIARLPLLLRDDPAASVSSLLRQVVPVSTSLEALSAAVREHLEATPSLVETWLCYSQDQRITEGWYLVKDGGVFIVGFAPSSTAVSPSSFRSGAAACTAFIMAAFIQPLHRATGATSTLPSRSAT